MTYIEDIFAGLFDSLRANSDVISITKLTAITYNIETITTEHLAVNDYVVFSDTDTFTEEGYKVKEVISSTEFSITARDVTIGALGTWKSQSWYFLPARTIEMSNEVTKNNGTATKKNPTPAGWLITGFQRNRTEDIRFETETPSLRLVLFNRTSTNSTTKKIEENYKPIIDVFFDRLINLINRSTKIFIPRNGIEYEVVHNGDYDNTSDTSEFTIKTDAKIVDFTNIQIINNNCTN